MKIFRFGRLTVSLRRIFLNLFFLFFFSFPYIVAVTQAQEEDIYRRLREQWIPVTCVKMPLGFETIFRNLDKKFWPALPESYEWRIEENGNINLYKHEDAPDRQIEFVTYFTDSLERFNFLSRWDGTTQHSFAYTRNNLSNDGLRKTYPVAFPGYWCGHCIDFLDTQGISEISKCQNGHTTTHATTVIESISTLDPRNYIPEPDKDSKGRDIAYWSRTARTQLVEKIRKVNGAYAQYMYYSFSPKRTNGTAIPLGIYFVQVSPSLISYNVPWPQSNSIDRIHSGNDTNWQQRLRAPNDFIPSPFMHEARTKSVYELPANFPVDFNLSYEQEYNLFMSADHEIKSIRGKTTLVRYLLIFHPIDNFIASWIQRLIKHAEILKSTYEGRVYSLEKDVRVLHDALERSSKKDSINQQREDHQLIAHLYSLLPEHQMNIGREMTPHASRSSSRLKSQAMPLVYVNVEKANSIDKQALPIAQTIVNMLKRIPSVHVRLINITTARAKQIDEQIDWDSLAAEMGVNTTSLTNRMSGKVDPNKKYSTPNPKFPNCDSATFVRMLCQPIEVDGKGNTQDVAARILQALEENPVEHILLRDLSSQQNKFFTILDNLKTALRAREQSSGGLKRIDLHRLSNYTVITGEEFVGIDRVFNEFRICAAMLPSNFKQQVIESTISTRSSIVSISQSTPTTANTSALSNLFSGLGISNSQQGSIVLPATDTVTKEPEIAKSLDSEFAANSSLPQHKLTDMSHEYTESNMANLIRSYLSQPFKEYVLDLNSNILVDAIP